MRPTVDAHWSDKYQRTLYHVSAPDTSKRLIFDAENLQALADTINRVLKDSNAIRVT
jgi:hypothetical protein